MRQLILFFLLLSSAAFSQTTVLNRNGIGDLKVGMKKAEVEKLIGKTITLKNTSGDTWMYDTVKFIYKEVPYEVLFTNEKDEKEKNYTAIYEVRSASALVKTKSGISIGDDKLKIINTYDGYSIHITPTYEGNDFTIKSKTKSFITLFGDDSNNVITFYLDNNKVIAMSVGVFEGC